jgi:hypothetical protein
LGFACGSCIHWVIDREPAAGCCSSTSKGHHIYVLCPWPLCWGGVSFFKLPVQQQLSCGEAAIEARVSCLCALVSTLVFGCAPLVGRVCFAGLELIWTLVTLLLSQG